MFALVVIAFLGYDKGTPLYEVRPMAYNLTAEECSLVVGFTLMTYGPQPKHILTCETMEHYA